MAHPPKHLHDPPAVKRAFERVRALCLALEGAYEKEAWGEPTFRVEKGKMFLMFADDHHGDGRVGFWCMSTADAREALVEIDADRFYVPPYMGPSGWVGVQITGKPPWDIVEEVIREGHRLSAPKAKLRVRAGVPAKAMTPAAAKTTATTKATPKTTATATAKATAKTTATATAKATAKTTATAKATAKAKTKP